MTQRTSITDKNLLEIFKDISETFDISYEKLKNEFFHKIFKRKKKRKKTILKEGERCMARKQDGEQCTRRKKDTHEYCGKHIKNRPYGRIDNNDNNRIKVKNKKEIEYLIDDDKIIYNLSGNTVIGRLKENGEIFYM